ncbi:sensor histidine kinase [Kribbella solani]|uniref:histidine kinase n=1 Tax=Kribbella solani TaxID=236067 RepID=A0A841DVP1_9ACTN|nr:histidine kinase [Kribbella solani]MBB5980810.1 signal transduction histidine kinase [Kribbella solani]
MDAVSQRWRNLRVPPLLLDAVLAFVIMIINGISLSERQHGHVALTLSGTVLITAGAVFMMLRRPFPVIALALTSAVGITYTITQQAKSPIGLFMACAAYTVVMRTERRTRAVAIVSVMAVTVVAAAVYTNGELFANLMNGIVVLFGAAIGEATRYRRAYLRELEERAVRAEQSRDEEAHRRVTEERLRIAHELHDVIAHHIALINVQSGVAAHVLRTQPAEAERALALVRSGGRTVLQELTVLLGVLRRSGSPLPTAPAPSLHDLDALIKSFTAAGLKVEWNPPEALGPLPDVIELTAYRLIQESLTNVLKHAPGATAQVTITRRPGTLNLTVTDTGRGLTSAGAAVAHVGAGHGLVGMRERVAAVRGRLTTGPEPAGGFAVRATLPLETGVMSDDQGVAGGRPDADPERVPGAGELGAGPTGRR